MNWIKANGTTGEEFIQMNRIWPSDEGDFQSVIMGFIAELRWRYTLNSHWYLAVKKGSTPQSFKIIVAEMPQSWSIHIIGELLYGLLPRIKSPKRCGSPLCSMSGYNIYPPERSLPNWNGSAEPSPWCNTRQKPPYRVRTRAARRREGTLTALGRSPADSAKSLTLIPKISFHRHHRQAHHGSLRQGYPPGCCSQDLQRSSTLRNTKKHLSRRHVVLWYDLQKTWVANLISSVCLGYNCNKVGVMIYIRTNPWGDRWLILVVGGVIHIPRSST